MERKTRDYQTDVLVLGSSSAGCGAAISAARAGADVLVVDKGHIASSGCLGGGNDHFMVVLDEVEHDGLEDLRKYYATPTSGLSDGMVDNYYRAMRPALAALEEGGVEFMHNEDGSYMRSPGFGQPGPWWIHINHGYTVKPKVARLVKQAGAKILNNCMVISLLTDGNRVAGCVGFDVLKGDFIVIRAKTAVLCLGLTAQRVSNNSTHKPFNLWFSPYVTGSQVMLPLEAGAAVLNIDIADMATLIPKAWGAPGMNGINNMGGRELNALGERFMGKYDPMWENGLRRNQVMGTFKESLEGSGPPFFMDMRHFSKEEARHLQYDLMPGDKETYLDYCRARDIDFTRAPLEVEISERMIGGVVRCNDSLESDVKNLFAGSLIQTFSGSFCLGWAAGEAAARAAAGSELPPLPQGDVDEVRARVYLPLEAGPDAITYTEFEDGVRQVMDYYLGYQRNENGILHALKSFAVLEGYAPRLGAESLRDLMRVHESRELFKLVRIYARACLERKESGRAMYRRSDYPNLDPRYDCCLITRLDEDGKPRFSWTKSPAEARS